MYPFLLLPSQHVVGCPHSHSSEKERSLSCLSALQRALCLCDVLIACWAHVSQRWPPGVSAGKEQVSFEACQTISMSNTSCPLQRWFLGKKPNVSYRPRWSLTAYSCYLETWISSTPLISILLVDTTNRAWNKGASSLQHTVTWVKEETCKYMQQREDRANNFPGRAFAWCPPKALETPTKFN